jgi:hypothetical protein
MPDADDRWRELQIAGLEHARMGQWGLFANVELEKAEYLQRERRPEDALDVYLWLCYLDLNGPENEGTMNGRRVPGSTAFNPKVAVLAPEIVKRIRQLAASLAVDNLGERFIAGATRRRMPIMPIPPDQVWPVLEAALAEPEAPRSPKRRSTTSPRVPTRPVETTHTIREQTHTSPPIRGKAWRGWLWLLLIVAVLALLALAGCGTFSLGRVQPQAGTSAQQQQLDTLTCKDEARLAVENAGQQTKDFLLGLTIIGAPLAYETDKAKQRKVFADCMQAKGYVVIPPDDSAPTAAPAAARAPTTTAVAQRGADQLQQPDVLPIGDGVTVDWPPGFESKPPTDAQRRAGIVATGVNRTADVSVYVVVDRHAGVADVSTYALSKRAALVSRLTDAVAGDITLTQVGGRKAFRCEGGGVLNGIRLKGLQTVVEGNAQLVVVTTWTSDANWQNQASLMRALADRVGGIR